LELLNECEFRVLGPGYRVKDELSLGLTLNLEPLTLNPVSMFSLYQNTPEISTP
jgi:hypothetical protein